MHPLQKLVSEVDSFLRPVGVMANEGIVGPGRRLGPFVEDLVGGVTEPRQAVLHTLYAATRLGHTAPAARGTVAVAADPMAIVPVVVQAYQLEVQLWDRVEEGEVRDVKVPAQVSVHTALVGIQLVASIRLVGDGVRLGTATTSSRGVSSGAAGPLMEERAEAVWVVVAKVVVAEDHEPGVIRELLVHRLPRGIEAARARPGPIEVVTHQQDEEQRGPGVGGLPVAHVLLHFVGHLPLPSTAAIAAAGAASIVADHQIVIVGELSIVASDAPSTGRDVQIVRGGVEVGVVLPHPALVEAPVRPLAIHVPVS
mmetsp:Transcript_28608/g.68045  ORF Transcript_28608/g.68045 Transcript_28608/m.68045 type:complete len:311 (-) Transcript_28608:558-1490(-)